jgi:hypothetical protein
MSRRAALALWLLSAVSAAPTLPPDIDTKALVKRWWSKFDTNQDKKLSLPEAEAAVDLLGLGVVEVPDYMPAIVDAELIEAAFNHVDANGNGFVTKDELRSVRPGFFGKHEDLLPDVLNRISNGLFGAAWRWGDDGDGALVPGDLLSEVFTADYDNALAQGGIRVNCSFTVAEALEDLLPGQRTKIHAVLAHQFDVDPIRLKMTFLPGSTVVSLVILVPDEATADQIRESLAPIDSPAIASALLGVEVEAVDGVTFAVASTPTTGVAPLDADMIAGLSIIAAMMLIVPCFCALSASVAAKKHRRRERILHTQRVGLAAAEASVAASAARAAGAPGTPGSEQSSERPALRGQNTFRSKSAAAHLAAPPSMGGCCAAGCCSHHALFSLKLCALPGWARQAVISSVLLLASALVLYLWWRPNIEYASCALANMESLVQFAREAGGEAAALLESVPDEALKILGEINKVVSTANEYYLLDVASIVPGVTAVVFLLLASLLSFKCSTKHFRLAKVSLLLAGLALLIFLAVSLAIFGSGIALTIQEVQEAIYPLTSLCADTLPALKQTLADSTTSLSLLAEAGGLTAEQHEEAAAQLADGVVATALLEGACACVASLVTGSTSTIIPSALAVFFGWCALFVSLGLWYSMGGFCTNPRAQPNGPHWGGGSGTSISVVYGDPVAPREVPSIEPPLPIERQPSAGRLGLRRQPSDGHSPRATPTSGTGPAAAPSSSERDLLKEMKAAQKEKQPNIWV